MEEASQRQRCTLDALKAFQAEFPTVSLRLHSEALGAVTQMVIDGRAAIAIAGAAHEVVPGIERVAAGSVALIPVAAPDHPLARARRNSPGVGRNHVQLVVIDRSARTLGRDLEVVATRTWRVTDLGMKHMPLKAGIGWGNMPEPTMREDIAAGRLVRLDMADYKGGTYRLHAIYRTDSPPGPAGTWLINRFVAQQSDHAIARVVARPSGPQDGPSQREV